MQRKKILIGSIKRHPDGFGFFIPDDKSHPDVYISKHSMQFVMTNDRVMIEVFPERRSDRFRGEIIKVLSRGISKAVGLYSLSGQTNRSYGLIKDDSKCWGQDLQIKSEDSLNANPGQLVVVEIISYPSKDSSFYGKVIEIIGNLSDPLNDIKRVLNSSNIPYEFPPSVIKEAEAFSTHPTPDEFYGRVDLRNKNFVTIDGATAKDFDDAVLVEKNNKGFVLYVAIADVSHYVKIGSSIDKEAYQRGTSVYFPNFVVPMLPENLSNGLCSLVPQAPRLCLTAEIHMDFHGQTFKTDFYESVIESKARVTYGEAQELIDGNEIDRLTHVKKNIILCADLAKILMSKRFREGSLDLELPETSVVIDASGTPVDIIKSERLFAHKLIEEMMLSANVSVAQFFTKRNIPSIFRIHEPPNDEAIHLLERYLWNFGGQVRLRGGKLQKALTSALSEFAGKPESQILNILTLRSMNQAKYHSNNVGHFGLGFENYTHFTSPIRRYPDLIVHRQLKSQILTKSKYKLLDEDFLATAGTFLSACEQRAVKAERQVVSIKKTRFISQYIGKEFDGVISGVARFGVFVLLRQYDVDGLIKLENLTGKHFTFDDENLILKSKNGIVYKIGDSVKILVLSTDIESGQINFTLSPSQVDSLNSTQTEVTHQKKPIVKKKWEKQNEPLKNRKSDRKNTKKRRKTQNHSRGLRKARVSSDR